MLTVITTAFLFCASAAAFYGLRREKRVALVSAVVLPACASGLFSLARMYADAYFPWNVEANESIEFMFKAGALVSALAFLFVAWGVFAKVICEYKDEEA